MVEVSIIIPTKNRPQLLNRAINSIINQTYQNWELLIINDSESEVLINFSDFYSFDFFRFLFLNDGVFFLRSSVLRKL